MSETVIRIREDGNIVVETLVDGAVHFKQIAPDTLIECINKSLLRGSVSSGLLPRGCLSFSAYDNGDRYVTLLHTESRADISYVGTLYPNFPLPKLVFGFHISKENRVSKCRLGIIANDDRIKPSTPMFAYPFSNVSGFSLCTGNNVLPKCESLHTLGSVPYYILGMPNNNDHFKPSNNKKELEMRDLLELLKDKEPEYYYSDILVANNKTLNDFISEGG